MKKLMLIAAALVLLAGSVASAAEWDFYGSARINTFYTDFENSPFQSPGNLAAFGLITGDDTKNYEQGLQGNARIGANVKVNDSLTGRFEYGAQSGDANVRILYGEWDFGAGSLLVGKHYTPLLFPYSNQVYSIHSLGKGDHNMSTFGMLYGARKAQVRLKFGGFQIAAVDCKTLVYRQNTNGGHPYGLYASQPDTELNFPSIQAKYKFDFKQGHVSVAGAYQTFEVLTGTESLDVDSYILGVGGRLNVGPAYFKGNIWGGQNVGNQADILVNSALWSTTGNASTSDFDGDGFGLAKFDGTKIVDRDALAYLLIAGVEIRKGLYLEAGYGYVKTELDEANAPKDDAETIYLQSTIFLAEGVFITPEIGYCDMKQKDDPQITYYGIKWQINF